MVSAPRFINTSSVQVLRATRPMSNVKAHGLITLQIETPLFVWTELLTHRRLSRNASSARAMSTDRYINMGMHEPAWFLYQGGGMQASDAPIFNQWLARLIWRNTVRLNIIAVKMLEKLQVAKEQRNRLIPPVKIVRGIVTGTEDAWDHFLQLRLTEHADKAMQGLAASIQLALLDLTWNYSHEHIPLNDDGDVMVAAARIARVSYAREKGSNDIQLAQRLLKDKHLSPFEHIAYWRRDPYLSNFTSKPNDRYYEDVNTVYGWESYRAQRENLHDPYGYNIWKP